MMAFAKADPDIFSRDLGVHLSKVLSENYAFLGSTFNLDIWASEHCEITVLPVKLTGLEYFSIFLPKGSSIRSEINDVYVLPARDISVSIYDRPPQNESYCAKPTFAVALNLLQGCENVDVKILVVTA